MTTVVDASAVVKWFVPETMSREARSLIDRPEPLVAPSLLLVEVAAVLLRKERRGEAEPNTASRATTWLRTHPIRFLSDADLLDEATHLARLHRHPVYDCLYIAAARRAADAIATFDQRLALVASRCFVSLVRWEE